jgi:hypothetical protein
VLIGKPIFSRKRLRGKIRAAAGIKDKSGNLDNRDRNQVTDTDMKVIAMGLLATLLLIGLAPFAAEAMILIVLEFGSPPLFQP